MDKIKFTGERMIPKLNKGLTFYYEHLNRYQFAAQFVKGKKVLDLACGSGYGSQMLSGAGAIQVIGVDISKEAIVYAKRNYGGKGIAFRVGDALKTGLEGESFDVVVCFEFIEHIEEQDNLMREIKRLLVPGGLLIMSTPNSLTYTEDNQFHKKELSLKEFRKILQKYFKNVEIYNQYFWFSNFIVSGRTKPEMLKTLAESEEEDSQYYVAVCSDEKLKKISWSLVASNKVDGMDVSLGTQPLGKTFAEIGGEKAELKRALNEITSSRTYKAWQFYCQIRDKLLGRERG